MNIAEQFLPVIRWLGPQYGLHEGRVFDANEPVDGSERWLSERVLMTRLVHKSVTVDRFAASADLSYSWDGAHLINCRFIIDGGALTVSRLSHVLIFLAWLVTNDAEKSSETQAASLNTAAPDGNRDAPAGGDPAAARGADQPEGGAGPDGRDDRATDRGERPPEAECQEAGDHGIGRHVTVSVVDAPAGSFPPEPAPEREPCRYCGAGSAVVSPFRVMYCPACGVFPRVADPGAERIATAAWAVIDSAAHKDEPAYSPHNLRQAARGDRIAVNEGDLWALMSALPGRRAPQ